MEAGNNYDHIINGAAANHFKDILHLYGSNEFKREEDYNENHQYKDIDQIISQGLGVYLDSLDLPNRIKYYYDSAEEY